MSWAFLWLAYSVVGLWLAGVYALAVGLLALLEDADDETLEAVLAVALELESEADYWP